MNVSRKIAAFSLVFSLLAFSLATLGPVRAMADDLPMQVAPRSEIAEIGKLLVLDVSFTLPPGAVVPSSSIELEVSAADEGPAFLDDPYPLKFVTPSIEPGQVSVLTGDVKVEWAATVLPEAEPGSRQLELALKANGKVVGSWSSELEVSFGEGWTEDRIANFIERRGLVVFLLFIFGFGLLMSLSPCIYPMIPITLAVIGAQRQEGTTILRGLGMSLTYALGLALVYGIIGYIAAMVFSGIIAVMQSAWVMVPVALLLVVLSFSMFGAYTLQAPAWLQNKLGGPGGQGRGGIFGVFFMGMVAGLIASPCVGPFLQGLLLVLATLNNPLLAFVALFIFGMGMSVLLIAVGTFPALLGSLPQSGGWMETVNKGMGLILVAMAFYFIRPGSNAAVMPDHVFWILAGLVTVLVSVFMGAFDRQEAGAGWWDRTRKALGIVVFLLGLYFLIGSVVANGFIMPSPWAGQGLVAGAVSESKVTEVADGPGSSPTAALPEKVQWEIIKTGENARARLDEARAQAKAAGQPVMLDFWATWCVYCKKLDKEVWNQPEVVEESLRFVTIKIDATDADDADMSAIKEEMKVAGLPRVVFIDSRGKVQHGSSQGYTTPAEMLAVMQAIR
jgi:thiol:disulfide interchange protein DsbD